MRCVAIGLLVVCTACARHGTAIEEEARVAPPQEPSSIVLARDGRGLSSTTFIDASGMVLHAVRDTPYGVDAPSPGIYVGIADPSEMKELLRGIAPEPPVHDPGVHRSSRGIGVESSLEHGGVLFSLHGLGMRTYDVRSKLDAWVEDAVMFEEAWAFHVGCARLADALQRRCWRSPSLPSWLANDLPGCGGDGSALRLRGELACAWLLEDPAERRGAHPHRVIASAWARLRW